MDFKIFRAEGYIACNISHRRYIARSISQI